MDFKIKLAYMSQKIFDNNVAVILKSKLKAWQTSICWSVYIRFE